MPANLLPMTQLFIAAGDGGEGCILGVFSNGFRFEVSGLVSDLRKPSRMPWFSEATKSMAHRHGLMAKNARRTSVAW